MRMRLGACARAAPEQKRLRQIEMLLVRGPAEGLCLSPRLRARLSAVALCNDVWYFCLYADRCGLSLWLCGLDCALAR